MSWSEGDWMCAACQYQNFKKRDACYNCEYPKFGGPDASSWIYNRPPLAGDWKCTCGYHNFARRSTCNRCGASKSDGSFVMKDGDWICSRYECREHNYASRRECYKCRTPRR